MAVAARLEAISQLDQVRGRLVDVLLRPGGDQPVMKAPLRADLGVDRRAASGTPRDVGDKLAPECAGRTTAAEPQLGRARPLAPRGRAGSRGPRGESPSRTARAMCSRSCSSVSRVRSRARRASRNGARSPAGDEVGQEAEAARRPGAPCAARSRTARPGREPEQRDRPVDHLGAGQGGEGAQQRFARPSRSSIPRAPRRCRARSITISVHSVVPRMLQAWPGAVAPTPIAVATMS